MLFFVASLSVATAPWKYKSIPLSVSMGGGDQIMIRAINNPTAGMTLLDNIKIITRQHCIPRYTNYY